MGFLVHHRRGARSSPRTRAGGRGMATTQNQGKRRRHADPAVRRGAARAAEQNHLLDNDALVAFYREMVLIRLFEEAAQRAFRRGMLGGYLHVYVGQEAVAAGFLDAYRPGDRVITAYRDHAHALLLGSEPKTVMAELYG